MWESHGVVLFREYMGTGLIMIWFLVAVVYLFLKEKRKPLRILFVYAPVILLILFFNPLFDVIATRDLGNEIYYRVLWLLPVTIVIAYTCVTIGKTLAGKKRVFFAAAALFLTVMSGKYVYANPFFSKAQNLYHIPDSVVHICDAIEVDGREVTAVFPLELVQYVRQYSPVVCMPYGREMLVEGWNEWASEDELCDAMEEERIDAGNLGALAREENCNYIVLSGKKMMDGSLSDSGYDFWKSTDGYIIYKDRYFEADSGTE